MPPEPRAPTQDEAHGLREGAGHACAAAASWIGEADVLLLCTGAGFSADSGLATYATVADVGEYARRELSYADLCRMDWLREEPELFWGFWGQCFNDFRGCEPHEGYRILDAWAESRFRHSALAASIREELHLLKPSGYAWDAGHNDPYEVTDSPGAFFVITSNVDAHHFDWFRACEVRECHGNIELYQCAKDCSSACPGVWRAPLRWRFEVDLQTMLAPSEGSAAPSDLGSGVAPVGPDNEDEQPYSPEFVPHVGHVHNHARPATLRHMPPSRLSKGLTEASFRSNHPRCPYCGGQARPAILMFDDFDWQDVKSQRQRKELWLHAVLNLIGLRGRGALRVAVLEIGAGGNVTTVRNASEQILRGCIDAGADARLVRVNPLLPLGDEDDMAPGGRLERCVISVMLGGLEALRLMDQVMSNGTVGYRAGAERDEFTTT